MKSSYKVLIAVVIVLGVSATYVAAVQLNFAVSAVEIPEVNSIYNYEKWVSKGSAIQGSASVGSGTQVTQVAVSIYNMDTQQYWQQTGPTPNEGLWQPTPVWNSFVPDFPGQPTTTWTYAYTPTQDGHFIIYARACDETVCGPDYPPPGPPFNPDAPCLNPAVGVDTDGDGVDDWSECYSGLAVGCWPSDSVPSYIPQEIVDECYGMTGYGIDNGRDLEVATAPEFVHCYPGAAGEICVVREPFDETDPIDPDSDGDGYTDGEEKDRLTDPNDPFDFSDDLSFTHVCDTGTGDECQTNADCPPVIGGTGLCRVDCTCLAQTGSGKQSKCGVDKPKDARVNPGRGEECDWGTNNVPSPCHVEQTGKDVVCNTKCVWEKCDKCGQLPLFGPPPETCEVADNSGCDTKKGEVCSSDCKSCLSCGDKKFSNPPDIDCDASAPGKGAEWCATQYGGAPSAWQCLNCLCGPSPKGQACAGNKPGESGLACSVFTDDCEAGEICATEGEGCVCTVYDAGPPGPGVDPVAALTFDTESFPPDTLAIDTSGNGNDATCTEPGCPATAPGASGNGVIFTPTESDNLAIASSDTINNQLTRTRSYSVWASSNNPASGGLQMVYEEGNSAKGFNIYFYNDGTGNKVYIGWWGSGIPEGWLSSAIPDTNLHHIVFNFDGTAGVQELWVDNNLEGSDTQVGSIEARSGNNVIGNSNGPSSCEHASPCTGETIEGTIDQFRVYNSALEPADIAILYAEGSG